MGSCLSMKGIILKGFCKEVKMYDEAIGKMREARALMLEERDNGKNSRELSVALTELDTAILWREKDLSMKTPIENNASLPTRFA